MDKIQNPVSTAFFKTEPPLPSNTTFPPTNRGELVKYLRHKCVEKNTELISPMTFDKNIYYQFLVDDKYKILFCGIPKVASSNWRNVLLVLSGKVNATNPMEIDQEDTQSKFRPLIPTLNSYMRSHIRYRLKDYYKFMFVRHPLERLLSAWRDKLHSNLSSRIEYRRPLVKHIARVYRNVSRQLDSESLDRVQIRFDEFLRFVVDQAEKGAALNEHWERFHKLCHPCTVRYDFVGRYEHLEEDAMRVLESVHADRMVRFPERSAVYKHSRTTDEMQQFYKDIPASLLKRVYRCFQEDFELFNYTVPEYLQIM
ncbi:carbohydrate sulfotransferase 11-like [Littorina saxatilis]